MASLILDHFNGEGDLAGRTPDIGPTWNPFWSNGEVIGGYATAYGGSSFNYWAGQIDIPAGTRNQMSFRVAFEVLASTRATLYLAFGANIYRTIFNAEFDGSTLGVVWYLGAVSSSDLVWPGPNEIIVAMDFVKSIARLYINGVVVAEGNIPEGEEGSLIPSSGPQEINIGGATNVFDGTPYNINVLDFEVTDTFYAPPAGVFWKNLVLCSEIP